MGEYDDIHRLFEADQEDTLRSYLRLLHPTDIAELFNFVDEAEWTKITRKLPAEILAEVLTELENEQITTLGEYLNPDRLVAAVDELESDDAADVLGELADAKTAEILAKLEDRDDIASLLAYPEDSAGGIMQTELCRVTEGDHVAEAIEAVRKARDEVEDVLEVYVVDAHGRITGTVALEDLVLSNPEVTIESLVEPIEARVTPDIDQEEVAAVFGKFDLYTLPVVDSDGVLLGRITYDDIHDVVEEEASEDLMASVGASSEDLVYSNRYFRIALFRLPWLATSLGVSLTAGFLLTLFRSFPDESFVVEAVLAASLGPVVMAMTGNIGSQAAMIVTRGFAVGKVDFGTLGRTILREISVGIMLGAVAGIFVGFVAYFFWQNEIRLGIAVSVAIVTSMTVASGVGATAPAVFKKVGIDPAIASGPLVTTGCDLLGVGIYLLVALVILT
ncbi:MAG: magnesium transporter [Deltaproteobacteria bacterium RIFOXYA12_FULL_58_15]|nr:MAG: magnesium transporter [Deltaproteobacteria bacterium RIFOXYA12_FULL_58_15]